MALAFLFTVAKGSGDARTQPHLLPSQVAFFLLPSTLRGLYSDNCHSDYVHWQSSHWGFGYVGVRNMVRATSLAMAAIVRLCQPSHS